MNYLTCIPDDLIFYIYSIVFFNILKSKEFKNKFFQIKTRNMSLKQRNQLATYYT